MRKLLILTLSTVLAATTATGVQAKGLKWMAGPPGLPAGSTFAVVSGDPGKAGMFTIQARLPANYVIPPHKHPTDEKVGVVSGGPFTYGMGDKIDRSASAAIDKGYHVTMGAAMNHWGSTGDKPTTIYVTAMGPFAITYANPKDDPRTK